MKGRGEVGANFLIERNVMKGKPKITWDNKQGLKEIKNGCGPSKRQKGVSSPDIGKWPCSKRNKG